MILPQKLRNAFRNLALRTQETLEFLSSRDQFWLELCVLMHPAVIQAFCKKGVRITEALSLDQYVQTSRDSWPGC